MCWRQKIIGVGRFVGAALPFVLACYGGILYASQDRDLELARLLAIEIAAARQEERTSAIAARIDAIDKTLWWLMMATFGSTGVSGVVAADRAAHKWRNSR